MWPMARPSPAWRRGGSPPPRGRTPPGVRRARAGGGRGGGPSPPGGAAGLLALDEAQQPLGVQRLGAVEVAEVGPLLAGAVGGELDPVAVGVGEVDRLVGAVVRRALDRRSALGETQRGAGELLAGWKE